jgi:CheY-like chemotaxis protein
MVERLSVEVRQILDVELELRSVDLGAMIESIIAGLPSHERTRTRHVCGHSVMIRGDEARLRFGIANLLTMTLASALPGSVIVITTSRHGRRGLVSILAACRPRDHEWVAFDIVCRIAGAHGGSASVATLEDSVRICIELPAAARAPRNWPSPVRLLLVDDNVQQVVALAEVLRNDGITVDCATSGRDALARIAARIPDMLLIDMQLPDVQGVDVIQYVRARKHDIPIALLTGYPPDHPVVAQTIARTGSAYVSKPVDIDALIELIARAVAA